MAQLTDLEKVRRSRARRKLVHNLATLLLFAAIVVVVTALVRHAGDFDLKTAYSDITAEVRGGDGFPVVLPGGNVVALQAAGETLVLLTDTNLYTYNRSGGQMLDAQHGMANQAMKTAKERILLYDRGGTRVELYSRATQVCALSTDFTIHTADVAPNGNFAVVTGASDALARVVVYNKRGSEIFRFSSDKPIISLDLADSRDLMYIGFTDTSNGEFLSSIRKFQLSYNEGDLGRKDFPGELLLSVESLSANSVRAFTDQRVVLLDGDMRETASYIFGDGQLERYCVAPDGRLVLVMGNYEKDKRLSIVTLDRDLTQINRFETDINVMDICADNNYLYLMARDHLHVLGFDGSAIVSAQIGKLQSIETIGSSLYYAAGAELDSIDAKQLGRLEENKSAASDSSSFSQASASADETSPSTQSNTSGDMAEGSDAAVSEPLETVLSSAAAASTEMDASSQAGT